jgi:hypothetical protein
VPYVHDAEAQRFPHRGDPNVRLLAVSDLADEAARPREAGAVLAVAPAVEGDRARVRIDAPGAIRIRIFAVSAAVVEHVGQRVAGAPRGRDGVGVIAVREHAAAPPEGFSAAKRNLQQQFRSKRISDKKYSRFPEMPIAGVTKAPYLSSKAGLEARNCRMRVAISAWASAAPIPGFRRPLIPSIVHLG